MDDSSTDDIVEIGRVARPHGIRGELRVNLHNPDSSILGEVEQVFVAGKRYTVLAARPAGGAVLLRLGELRDRNAAELLRKAVVGVARADLGLAEGEVLLADLVGCRLELADGTGWGTVAAIVTGVQDRLVVHDGDVERELPVVDDFLVEVDLEQGRVVVDPPEDLPEWPLGGGA